MLINIQLKEASFLSGVCFKLEFENRLICRHDNHNLLFSRKKSKNPFLSSFVFLESHREMTTGSTGSFIPKWQLALLLGAPVALGLGYLYYRNQNLSDDATTNDKKDKKSLGELKGQTISLDGDDKNAEKTDKPATKLTPLEVATQYKNEGNAMFKKGKYDEAIVYYDKAIETCPANNSTDLSLMYQNRAAAYEQLNKWSAVKADCTRALELNPRYIKALHRRARAHEHINDLASSLEDVTATCILEGFQNNSSLMFADKVLKQMGKI